MGSHLVVGIIVGVIIGAFIVVRFFRKRSARPIISISNPPSSGSGGGKPK